MAPPDERIPDDAARAIWLRAAHLQAEAERRAEERAREIPAGATEGDGDADGLRAEDVRAAAEEVGIAPEYVQIALAEAAVAGRPTAASSRLDTRASDFLLGAHGRTIEATALVRGDVDVVSAAVLQVFCGHPCLLQAGEVVDLPGTSGRVIVFNVPKFDWGATANPPFVEKASVVLLRQVHVAIRPLADDPSTCEVVAAGDLQPGMRSRWRLSAATTVAAGAAGGAAGAVAGAATMAGALVALPVLAGVGLAGGAAVGSWVLTYRYYRKLLIAALQETLGLLPTAVRALSPNDRRRSRHLADADERSRLPAPEGRG